MQPIHFQYQALNADGRMIHGAMMAADKSSLEQKLQEKGLWLLSSHMRATRAPSNTKSLRKTRFSGHRSRRALIEFFTIMAFQSRAGIPMLQAIDAASSECSHPKFTPIVKALKEHIEKGDGLWEAMSHYPGIFESQTVSIIRAGELSSQLPEAFDDLSSYLEWVDKMLSDIKRATIYPSIVACVVALFVLVLFSAVIPQFAKLLGQVNVPLPLLTQIVFGTSMVIKDSMAYWMSFLILMMIGLPLARRSDTRFRKWTDDLKFSIPLLGPIYHMLAMSRVANHLSITTKSGIPILQAFKLCNGLVRNLVVDEAIEGTRASIEAGDQVSDAMRKHAVFPSMMVRMVMIGERTGSLDHALQSVTQYYNTIIPRKIKKLFSIIEPAIILFLIFIVGSVAVAVFMPMLSLMDNIK